MQCYFSLSGFFITNAGRDFTVNPSYQLLLFTTVICHVSRSMTVMSSFYVRCLSHCLFWSTNVRVWCRHN